MVAVASDPRNGIPLASSDSAPVATPESTIAYGGSCLRQESDMDMDRRCRRPLALVSRSRRGSSSTCIFGSQDFESRRDKGYPTRA